MQPKSPSWSLVHEFIFVIDACYWPVRLWEVIPITAPDQRFAAPRFGTGSWRVPGKFGIGVNPGFSTPESLVSPHQAISGAQQWRRPPADGFKIYPIQPIFEFQP